MTSKRMPFPGDLVLTPASRWPTTLPGESERVVLDTPVHGRVPHRGRSEIAPLVSIVVVTIDALVFTRLCLESVLACGDSIPFEVIVVDNGSGADTASYLKALSTRDDRVRVTYTGRNLGFATATNAGVALARGRVLILLNNDTIVVDGWLDRMVSHLGDRSIGLVGAVTNRAGNEAEIESSYRTLGELHEFASAHAQTHAGGAFDIRTALMFCTGLRRDVWDEVGPLDERFRIGLFEDDDYSMRVRRHGYRVACAEDVFVHHFGQASIGRLGPTGEYGSLFHANRSRWEAKWGAAWRPYERRSKPSYEALVERVRAAVADVVPPGATVAVISKGDARLLELDGCTAWHFPQCDDGTYAGHHPANDDECIAQLERVRAKGAQFLVIPSPAMWWLEHYRGFAQYLRTQCRLVLAGADCNVVMCSSAAEGDRPGSAASGMWLLETR
jgi:GT2 family glycosyltransferase